MGSTRLCGRPGPRERDAPRHLATENRVGAGRNVLRISFPVFYSRSIEFIIRFTIRHYTKYETFCTWSHLSSRRMEDNSTGTIPPFVPPSMAPRTPPREGEVADLSDLSADARRSSASFHALKRCRDAEEGDESSESQHGGPSMKRSGSLRDLGMAPHMSGVPMTKSGLSGCLDDMGLSGLGDSPHVRKAHQVHDLAAVPGSPATTPMGEDSPMMPKIDSVLSLPSASPSSHADHAIRTLSDETTAEVTTPTPTTTLTLTRALTLTLTLTRTLTLTLTLALT